MSITPEQLKQKLLRVAESLRKDDIPLRVAAYTVLAEQSKRIFTDGLNSAGGKIGQYDTKREMWLNPKGTARSAPPFNAGKLGSPRGKPRTTTNKKGVSKTVRPTFITSKISFYSDDGSKETITKKRKLKTVYIPNYKTYREIIGRESSFVNLELSGDLKFDFENPKSGTPTPIKVNEHEHIVRLDGHGNSTRELNIKKIEGNTARFGEFTKLTEGEKKVFFQTAAFEFRKLLAAS